MLKLLPVTIGALLAAAFSHGLSGFDRRTLTYTRKEVLLWSVVACVLILAAGLRTRYNDTVAYIHAYEMISDRVRPWEKLDWRPGENPGFYLVNRLLHAGGASARTFLLLYAAVTNGIFLWFIRKYSERTWLSVFLYLTLGCYVFTMAAVKQALAIALGLVATDRVLQKRYIRFLLWVLLATAFHPYALLYLVVPFLMAPPWGRRTIVVLTLCVGLGFGFRLFLPWITRVTGWMGEHYTVGGLSGEGIHPLRVAVAAMPALLSLPVKEKIRREDHPVDRLVVHLSILHAAIMFIGLFGTGNYLGRLANYFQIFQVLALPCLLRYYEADDRKILLGGMLVGYSLYFVYEMGIRMPFDTFYDRASLAELFR